MRRTTACLLALVCLALLSPARGRADTAAHAAAEPPPGHRPEPPVERVVAVHIASRVSGARLSGIRQSGTARPGAPDQVADDSPKHARADQGVTLHAILETRRGSERRFYSDADRVRLRGRTHAPLPMDQAPRAIFLWHRVEPAVRTMSNTASGRFRFEPIPYGEPLIPLWLQRTSVRADVRPSLTPDHGRGAGTMRFKLVALTADGTFATPGAEARRGPGSGGLSDRVHRVSLRRGDDYLGLLGELYGQPYIWASGGTSDRAHQTERLEGADCADFVVYGMRRLGHDIPYTWSEGLRAHTRNLGQGTPGVDGVYTDAAGRPLPFPRPGDLILFPRHVGVLVADRGVPGVLDGADIMLHTLFDSPRELPLHSSGYGHARAEILRWRVPRPARAPDRRSGQARSPAAIRSAR